MAPPSDLLVHIDGRPAGPAELQHAALVNYGHYTSAQLRGGRLRALSAHLDRLSGAHAELFGTRLDTELVRGRIRQAAALRPDAYLRVMVFEPEPGDVRIMTILRPPIDPDTTPQEPGREFPSRRPAMQAAVSFSGCGRSSARRPARPGGRSR